jgi:lysophospholipase L1-like esterase
MKLQTHISLHPENNQIDYHSEVLLMGSCFSENIGNEMEAVKFNVLQNPFGIIFNPLSIERLVLRALEGNAFSEKDLFEFEGYWRTFDSHSLLKNANKEALLSNLNQRLAALETYLKTGSHLFFTLGTAHVYRLKEEGKVVANCHKVPQKMFSKHLLSISEISESLHRICDSIRSVNHRAPVIFTVSPVRHLKDGFIENTRSKSHLIAAVHNTLKETEHSFYFPAYEIVMDELRDYRFYAEDMIHPNKTAIRILWDRFSQVWVASETLGIQKEIRSVQQGLNHRPFDPDSEAHREFTRKLEEKIDRLQQEIPHLKF